MSMNLNLELDVEKQNLYQTPTQISYMCVVQPDGSLPFTLTGKKAKHAIQIYFQWVRYMHCEGVVFETLKDFNEYNEYINQHIDTLKEKISKAKKIKLYIM